MFTVESTVDSTFAGEVVVWVRVAYQHVIRAVVGACDAVEAEERGFG